MKCDNKYECVDVNVNVNVDVNVCLSYEFAGMFVLNVVCSFKWKIIHLKCDSIMKFIFYHLESHSF